MYLKEQLRALPFTAGFLALWACFYFYPSLAMAIIAGTLLLIALVIAVEDLLLVRRGRRTPGTVVDHHAEENCFFPVVEFQDQDGAIRQVRTKTGSGLKSPPLGRGVVVICDSTGKYGCEIDSFWRRWGIALAIAGLGSLFAIGAALSTG